MALGKAIGANALELREGLFGKLFGVAILHHSLVPLVNALLLAY